MAGASSFSPYRPVVWVVGASRGIGAEIARQFAMIGAYVVISGRTVSQLRAVRKSISDRGGDAVIQACDCTKEMSVKKAARAIIKRFGRIDVLINNAGITVFKYFDSTTIDEFDAIIGTNLRGPVLCMREVLPGMMRRKKGWIINIISNAAVKAFEGSAAYTASKSGLLGFTRVLREEMRKYNVKVVAVLPGATETAMWSRKARDRHAKRMMKAKSVAEAVLAVYHMPPDVVADEILLRPIRGDID